MQHMITDITARYPRLNATYKFDTYDNKSVKCDPLDDGAAYEMSFVMSDDKAKELHNLCMEAYKTQPPKQVDAARNKLPDDFMLTTGSKCNVAVVVVPYNTGSINGVSLRLRAVQVLELAEMQGQDDPFTAVSGGFTASATTLSKPEVDDPFAMAASAPAPSALMDDDIPF